MMVYETRLEVPPDEGKYLPEEKLKVFEDLIQKVKLEIEDDESKIIKEEFIHPNNDAKVFSKKSGGLYKHQSISGLNPPEDISGKEKSIGINIHCCTAFDVPAHLCTVMHKCGGSFRKMYNTWGLSLKPTEGARSF